MAAERWLRRRLAVLAAAFTLGTSLVAWGAVPASAAPVALRTLPSPWVSGHAGLYGWGAATLLNGNVIIGDYWNYRVREFGTDGTYIRDLINNPGFGPTQHQSPYGLGVDPVTGDVYMADTDRYTIDKYDQDGNFLLTWGSQGDGPGKFRYPSRVAVRSDGMVFVADSWSNQIVIDTSTGIEVGVFGSFGTGDGQFKQPHGIAWDYGPDGLASIEDDRLYVVDTGNHRVQVFDKDGNFLFKFGSKGPGVQKFKGDLRGIAIDQANDWVYVVDAEGNRVRKFDLDGKWNLNIGVTATDPNNPGPGEFSDGGREVTVDNDGNIWVGDLPNFRAQKFSPTGEFLLEVPSPAAPPPDVGFNGPRGVAVDSNGNYFVTDTYNQRIVKYANDGTFITKWGSRGRDDYAFNYPRMIAVDPTDDSVVVADTDNHSIKKYTNDGVFVWKIGGLGTGGGKFKNPHGVDVGPDGTIYVADSRNGIIQVISAAGVYVRQISSKGTGPSQLMYPRGIAIDPVDESIWVADSNLDVVKHFANDGTYLETIGSKGTADNQFDNPFDVEVNAANVYIADTSRNVIKVWSRTGTFVEVFGGGGKKLGKLMQPQGMDFSPAGTLWVAEQKNERVQEWSV